MRDKQREERAARILIPVGDVTDEEKIIKALYTLSVFQTPLIVLLHIIEVPSRVTPLYPSIFKEEIERWEEKLDGISRWLNQQGYRTAVKIMTARNIAEGIISEAEREGYDAVVMLKRKVRGRLRRLLHRSISEKVIRHTNALVVILQMDRPPSQPQQQRV